MVVYLGTFVVASGCAFLGSRRGNPDGPLGPAKALALILAILLPAAVAGARASSVGTDTSGYGVQLFDAAVGNRSFVGFLADHSDGYEVGYLALCYLSARLGGFHVLLFLTELLTVGIVVVALCTYFKGEGLAAGYLAYLLVHFNESLNMMRQSLAMAIVLLAATQLLRGRVVRYVACVAVAALFHVSALIALGYLAIWWIGSCVSFGEDRGLRDLRVMDILAVASVVVAPAVLVLRFRSLPGLLDADGFGESKYAIYLVDSSNGVSIPIATGLWMLAIISCVLARTFRNGLVISLSMVIGSMLYLLTGLSQHLWRVSSYFTLISCILVGELFDDRSSAETLWRGSAPRRIAFRGPALVLCLSILGAMWYAEIVVWNNHDTLPYTTDFGW